MRTSNKKFAQAFGPAIVAATGLVVAAFALTVFIRIAHATPRIGDIVSFWPSSVRLDNNGTRLLVHRQDQFGCVLDLNVLRRSGGSLVLETRLDSETGGFRAHWAGVRTSDDAANCGNDADLVLDYLDLEVLYTAAGGYGTHAIRGAPVFTSSINIAN